MLMAGKVSVKTISAIFLLCMVVLVLCACIDPVDLQTFLELPAVGAIVDAHTRKVIIDPDSDDFDDLTPGDGIISGLTPGKYYMLEEYDDSNVRIYTRTLFIKPDGTYFGNLGGIGRLTGTQVTNLRNLYTYKVTSAQPFNPGNNTYEYFTFGNDNARDEAVVLKVNEITTATVGITGKDPYYLNLAPVINVNGNYEIMMIPSTEVWGSSSRTSGDYNSTHDSNLQSLDTSPPIPSLYHPYQDKNIGLYQYRVNVRTGSIPLQNKSIIALPDLGTKPDYIFAQYNSDGNVTQFTFLKVEVKKATIADDFTIGNLAQEYGSVTAVTITPKEGKSTGDITIFYEGTGSTTYAKSQTLPTELGNYAVTFNVAATADFASARGLSAGTLIISEATPTAGDYDISNLDQTEGSVTAVIITPKVGKSSGTVTIKYNGLGTLPTTAGTYTVTFDVAAAPNWKAVAGLSAGMLTIHPPVSIKIKVSFDGFSPGYDPNIDTNITATPDSLNPDEHSFSITLTLNNISGYNDIKWYKDDNSFLGSGVSITLGPLSDNSNADAGWWQEGIHYIYLELKDTNNLLPPLSGVIKITCNVVP